MAESAVQRNAITASLAVATAESMKSGDGDGWQLTWGVVDGMAEGTVRQDASTFNAGQRNTITGITGGSACQKEGIDMGMLTNSLKAPRSATPSLHRWRWRLLEE